MAYESKLLENAEIGVADIEATVGGTISVDVGTTMIIKDTNFEDASYAEVYRRTGGATSYTLTESSLIRSNTGFDFIGYTGITPQHNTISLDNSDSSGAKWFKGLAKDSNGNLFSVIMGEEMVSNVGAYDGSDGTFSQLTNGTLTDLNGNTVKTFFGATPLNMKGN